jgi:hypothetical protein
MDKAWSAIFDTSSLMTDSGGHGTQIDTPWPLDATQYKQVDISNLNIVIYRCSPDFVKGVLHPGFRSVRTLHKFIAEVSEGPAEGISSLALLAKASLLLECASFQVRQWRPGMFVARHWSVL